jgi:catechol 2,3-dioxygenase-like lactoylglutathione lyase family enzyme
VSVDVRGDEPSHGSPAGASRFLIDRSDGGPVRLRLRTVGVRADRPARRIDRGADDEHDDGAARAHPSRQVTPVSTSDNLVLAATLLYVRQLDRSVAFYEDVFELRVHTRHADLALLESADGAPVLAVRSIGENATRGLEQVGISRLVWFAPEARVRGLRERLRRTGSQELFVDDRAGDRESVVFADPDGIAHVVVASGEAGWPGHEAIPRAAWLRGV